MTPRPSVLLSGLCNTQLIGGAVTVVSAGFVLEESSGYGRGTVMRMGPGFFPTLLGVALLILGGILLLRGLRSAVDRISRPEIRSLVCIGGGIALFAGILPRFGMAPAIVALVMIAAGASPHSRPKQTIILAATLTCFAWLVFVKLLSLPLPMLSW